MKFVPKVEEFEAFQFNKEKLEEFSAMIEATSVFINYDDTTPSYTFESRGSNMLMHDGDYIAKDQDGFWKVTRKESFEANYEPFYEGC